MSLLPSVSLGSVAVVAAAVIAAELLHRRDDDLDEASTDRFSVTAVVAAAAAIVLGPALAAAVAGLGTLGVRRLSGDPWREGAVRAGALALAACAGGVAYTLAGATTGAVTLPDDLLPVVVLGVAFSAAKTLVARVAARATSFETDLLAAAAEVSLGVALAVAAASNLWYAALLVPVLLLLERLHWRLIATRREVAAALETFANIVDERDRSTHGHSQRVADHVRALAEALALPRSDVRRLWWAGRLHDLGKVAVDAAVLAKPTGLDDEEWSAVTRAPRLSARLLQRFRFAAQQAKAVEYHRERLDGSGYYGARDGDIPLAAHFLIIADSFDAMTSDRPFRRRLTREEALEEIEANAGTQFHPALAKAFVAVQRGLRPQDVLTDEELATLRDSSEPAPARPLAGTVSTRPDVVVALGASAGLVGFGVGLLELAAAGAVVAGIGARSWIGTAVRATRLSRSLDDVLGAPHDRTQLFGATVDVFEAVWPLAYALLVGWAKDGTGGIVELQRGESGVPDSELMSWLLREAESREPLIVDDGVQLRREGTSLALPLRRENSELVGFLVLGGFDRPPAHLLAAARGSLDRLGRALAGAPAAEAPRERPVAAAR